MMKLAVLSDIHGNLTALDAVLEDISQQNVELTWCLGDLAAGGPRASECVQTIKSLSEENEGKTFKVIGGNTDRYLVHGTRMFSPPATDEDAFKRLASQWQNRDTLFNWNVSRLTWEDYEFLKSIQHRELSKEIEKFGWVIGYHAIPGDDEAFLLADTPEEQVLDYLLDREGRLAVGGHTHREMDRQVGAWRVINVGSVGLSFTQPGIAMYGLFEFTDNECLYELRQIPYDVGAVIEDLHAVGYPDPEWLQQKLLPVKGTA